MWRAGGGLLVLRIPHRAELHARVDHDDVEVLQVLLAVLEGRQRGHGVRERVRDAGRVGGVVQVAEAAALAARRAAVRAEPRAAHPRPAAAHEPR